MSQTDPVLSPIETSFVSEKFQCVQTLKHKKVLITGASYGNYIGYMAACLYKLNSCSVTVLVRSEEKGQVAVNKLKELYLSKNKDASVIADKTFYVVGDLEKPETMRSCVLKASELMNGVDIVVISGPNSNSSSVDGRKYLGLPSHEIESHRLMHNVAVLSPLMICEEFKNLILTKSSSSTEGDYCICIVSSLASETAWPSTLHYNIAKAAQDCLIKNLAFEYSSVQPAPIRVVGVAPSAIHTQALDNIANDKNIPIPEYVALRASAHPLNKIGTSMDVANMILFITSSLASFMSGEIVKLDGGLSCTNWFNATYLLKQMNKI